MSYSHFIECNVTEEQKLICQICGKQCKNTQALAGHLGPKHQMKVSEYCIKFFLDGVVPKCKECNEPTEYVKGEFKFRKFCKKHFQEAKSEYMKNNPNLDYGWKKGLTKEDHPGIASQAEKISGENNAFYGAPIPHFNEETKQKSIAKMRISEEEFKTRILKIEQEKNIKFLSTYDQYTQINHSNLTFECLQCHSELENSLFWLENTKTPCENCRDLSHSEETKQKLREIFQYSKEKYEEKCKNNFFEVLTIHSDYKRKKDQKLDVKCKTCGDETKRTLSQIEYGTMCWKCNARSKEERQIQDFISSYGVTFERNTKQIITPNELDFFFPEHNFAIEFNGLFWHSENNKNKDYHKIKSEECHKREISLFHIFEDEWRDKQEIVKSMILNRLNLIKDKIPARKCGIKEIEAKQARHFFESTHIDGYTVAKKYFALMFDNEIVCCLSLRNPITKNYKNCLEIARFSSKLNTIVQGGFSKLLKYAKEWSKQSDYDKIITYADLRLSSGKTYSKDFTFVLDTGLSYWYTDFKKRFNRLKFRAIDNKTEKQIAEENQVYKIYGCGSKLFEMSL